MASDETTRDDPPCDHSVYVEITEMQHARRRFMCVDCQRQWWGKPVTLGAGHSTEGDG